MLDIICKARGLDHEQIARHAVDQLLGRVADEQTPYAGTSDAAQHEDIGRKLTNGRGAEAADLDTSVQLRIARGSTAAQDTLHIRKEMIMSTRTLDLTIPEVSGVYAAAMADPRTTNPLVEQAWRDKLIREAAYFRSQHRRPCHGKELEDWLTAEREVDESLRRAQG